MRTGKSDISGWLVRPAGGAAWAALAAVLAALAASTARARPDGGMDNAIVVRAARAWLAGGDPYDDPHFLYFPSAVLAAVPQALLPDAALRALVPCAVTVLLTAGWGCALQLHRVPGTSRLGVLGLTALAAGFAPFGHLIHLGNWTVTAAAALPLCLLLADRGRWVAAGAVLGAAVALKPLLAPVALLFLLAGRWRALAAAVLVPALASGAAALLMPDPAGFFTRTLPFLLHGDDGFVRSWEASLPAVLPRLGVPGPLAQVIALLAAGAGVLCARRRWRRAGPGPLRLAETGAGLMLSAFLVSRPSYDHYLLVVVPLLLAGVPYEDGVARRPWFWLALVPQLPGVTWPGLEAPRQRALKDAFTLGALAATVALHSVRGRAGRVPEGARAGLPRRARTVEVDSSGTG
ncbi:glycosyltransferase 87 family protein [Streptomyces fumanus]|uniref:Membrane protein n=1 Tax=Streptomyces fumanus TaxID=67302 RepID=A0A919AL82_9ACTN|nr:glycosyltransferase 87 family protein [Streptomyces fumanus]GHF13945.1 membrane protein [Streptomyces fumanus]